MMDENLWLEDVAGEAALQWVRQRNSETAQWACGPRFESTVKSILEVLDSPDKIRYASQHGNHCYNLWRTAEHPRGVWCRTSVQSYCRGEAEWETVLDVDALSQQEKRSWVFAQSVFLAPNHHRCLILLSPGGSDATVVREFDLTTRQFVPDGFTLPEAKTQVSWIDADTLWVASASSPEVSTASGYARTVRRWQRGTPFAAAQTVFEGATTDVSVHAWHDPTAGFARSFITCSPSFYTQRLYWLQDNQLQHVPVPDDAEVQVHRAFMVITLRSAWTVGGQTYAAGAVLGTRFDAFMAGERRFATLFEPSAQVALSSISWTRDHALLTELADVKTRVRVLTPGDPGWRARTLRGVPPMGTVSVGAMDDDSNDFLMVAQDFLSPTALWHGEVDAEPHVIQSLPAFFDAQGLHTEQHFATSADGTRVPYFQVSRQDLHLDGNNVTLLNGYGGFEHSLLPTYSGGLGRAWLTQGCVYVLANIRGGGEYGPAWHKAALRDQRPRAYEDFAAVAQDLIARGVTSPKKLGLRGGSNGGLLIGNMLVRYPELFGAAACWVPLLDMQRYTQLLAGASWAGEYGDPDNPQDWAYLQGISPYHNLRAGITYPSVLFLTSTRDDRVHPGHARKMMQRMRAAGHDVHYYENIEGGHGAAADNGQAAYMAALEWEFLRLKLRHGGG